MHFFQALSSLAILAREIFKAELQATGGFVNITSPLAMQMSAFSLPRNRKQRSLNASEDGAVHDGAVMVAIETFERQDTAKVGIYVHHTSMCATTTPRQTAA